MKDESKGKSQLIEELRGFRRRLEALEKAEAALAASERRHRMLLEHLPVVVFSGLTGASGGKQIVCGRVDELTGYAREEFLEDPGLLSQVVHPTDRERVAREVLGLRGGKSALDTQLRIVTRQGQSKWVRLRATARLDDRGQTAGIDGIAEDITARRDLEQSLARSRAELRAIYEHAPVLLCTLDADRRVVYANDEFTRFTGVAEAELRGGRACGVFGCINALEDPRGCGFGSSCAACGVLQAIEDTLATGTLHRDVEYRTTLVRGGERREVIMLACTARIPTAEAPLVLLCLHDITGRARAEQAQRETARELELTLEATTDGIWKWDFRTDRLSFSPRYYTMLGYAPGEFPATFESWKGLLHPDDREGALATESRYRASKPDVYEHEFRLRTKTGAYRWIRARARVVERGPTGEALRMIGNHEDVTEHRQAEAALRHNERRLRHAQEVARIGCWEWHVLTNETLWSDQVYRLFGLEPGQETPSRELAARFVHPEDLEQGKAAVAQAVESGDWFRCNYRVIRADGVEIRVHNEAEISRDREGRAVLFFGTAQDVTALHAATEALEARNREFELILDSVPAMVFLKDLQGRYLRVNRALCQATGIPEADWIGRTIRELLPSLARRYDWADRDVLAGGRARLDLPEPYESRQGLRWSRTDRVPIRDAQGEVRGLVGVAVDVTDDLRANEQLRSNVMELQTINRFALRAGRLRTVEELCRLAASEVRWLNPKAYVTVSFHDPAVGGPRVRAVAGLGRRSDELARLLGSEPTALWGKVADMGPRARAAAGAVTAGRLEEIPGGLAALSDGMISTEACQAITHAFAIQRVFSIGLTLDKRIMGGLSVLLPSGRELRHAGAIETLASHLAVVLHRLLAEEELAESRHGFRQLARRTNDLLEQQNARISRELHDDLGQSLTALSMDLSLVERDLRESPAAGDRLADTVADMRGLLAESLEKVRDLSQLLRPTVLDAAGILEALQWLLEDFHRRSGVATRLRSRVESAPMARETSLAVFRCAQEALTNCARHSQARHVDLQIRKIGANLSVSVKDDGVGFDPQAIDPRASLGLLGLREHAAAGGGSVQISSRPGDGTIVTIKVPLEEQQ